MFRRTLALALLVVWTQLSAAADPDLWFAARITVPRGGGVTAMGSGTPVACEKGKALILTNAHVCRAEDKGAAVVVTISGKEYPAKWVGGSGVDEANHLLTIHGPDLCLLEIEADTGFVEFRGKPVEEGDAVAQWGYGGSPDGKPVGRVGRVAAGTLPDSVADTQGSVPGDSGCGLFDEKGKLAGVVWGRNLDGTQGYAVPLGVVTKFVGEAAPAGRFPKLRERMKAVAK